MKQNARSKNFSYLLWRGLGETQFRTDFRAHLGNVVSDRFAHRPWYFLTARMKACDSESAVMVTSGVK